MQQASTASYGLCAYGLSTTGAPTRTLFHFEAAGPAGGVDAEPQGSGSARFEHPPAGGVDAEPPASGSARFEHPAAVGVAAEP
jgi:hypothetical protein